MADSLFVVTNRAFRRDSKTGGYILKDGLNPKGNKELRLFEARPRGADLEDWHLESVPDRVTSKQFDEAGVEPVTRKPKYRGSDLITARVAQRLRDNDRNLLLFIHGYNNTAIDAFRRAWRMAQRYNVEVIVFTWPANGGGERLLEDLHGVASYKSDKSDARSSTEALDRALGRMQLLLNELNRDFLPRVREEAKAAHPDSLSDQRAMMARLLRERACPFKVSLLAHSMGNYLYKKMLMSSSERMSASSVFDNVILKAADTNHEEHDVWIRRIRARRRVYVMINQNDSALRFSTMKIGEDQRVRLGNTLSRQDAPNATYIDCTPYVGELHSYFDEEDFERQAGQCRPLTDFLEKALNGEIAENGMPYRPGMNAFRME